MHDYDSNDCDSNDGHSTDYDLNGGDSTDCDLKIHLAKRTLMVVDHEPKNLRFDYETRIDKAG